MKRKRAFLALWILVALPLASRGADHTAVLPYIADDVAVIAHLDVRQFDLAAHFQALRGTNSSDGNVQPLPPPVAAVDAWFDLLAQNGVTSVYALLRATDLEHMGPTWVMTLAEGADPQAVIQMLTSPLLRLLPQEILPKKFKTADGVLIGAMNSRQLDAARSQPAGDVRASVKAALDVLGEGHVGLIVVGDAVSRRVIRELFPQLPRPYEKIDGFLIADQLLWGGLALQLSPEPRVMLHVQTSSEETAEAVQHAVSQGIDDLKRHMQHVGAASPPADQPNERPVPADAQPMLAILDLFRPVTDGPALRIIVGDDPDELSAMIGLMGQSLRAMHEGRERAERINRIRALALAFWQYESKEREFVQRASYDAEGRPLLSWRVHLLPYLGHQQLYEKFHLDEPWNSPHNRELIAQMPEVFQDPNPQIQEAVGAGRTKFVAPVHEATVFPPREALPEGRPLRVRDIIDGTSRTILFVEVVPERAVVWTAPDDWPVNLDRPLDGVLDAGRRAFTAAFCDGHVQVIANDVDPQVFRAMLTRAGKEPIQ